MKVAVFGATGLIGGGVLMEALDHPHVERVVSVGRRSLGIEHPKLREIVHDDFEQFDSIAGELADLDACFWCLGIASAGLDEASYTRITVDFTVAAARVMRERSPDITFCFVSGAGTNEQGRMMWARVKGRAESALRDMGFRRLALFRPGFIRDLGGTKPPSPWSRLVLPIYGLARLLGGASSNSEIGRAMIAVAMGKSDAQVLDSGDINTLAGAA